jgi:transcriptional accessory protein Tex/SPT6
MSTETETAPPAPAPEDPVPTSGPAVIVPTSVESLPDDIADDFEAAIARTVIEFKEGDIVEGTVVSVDADGAMVDVGYKSEGLIPTEELSIRASIDPSTIVSVGDKIEALVLNKEDDEGRLILSKKRAQRSRRHGQGNRHRSCQGWVDRRHRAAGVPARLPG